MARISDDAIQRNRVSSLARYHRNRDHAKKTQKAYRDRKFEEREFIGWDGEGYTDADDNHHYMLFGASTGACVTGPDLSTTECLNLILRVKRENPRAYNVGFAFEYDVNMILKDLPWRALALLHEDSHCRHVDDKTGQRFRIEHVPHKWLRVYSDGVSATIYDCFGFFHSGYLAALKKYGVGSKSKREHIERGKAARSRFTYADIDAVKAYWLDEISLLPPLMECIRAAAYGGGYRISEWHGPGALAAYLLRDVGAIKWHSKDKIPAEVKSAIRFAYAGGRFTGALCGLYLGSIYTADLNSAYIYACSLLPRMDRGAWKRQAADDVDPDNLAPFGVYRIEFDFGPEWYDKPNRAYLPEPPYPLFHRSKNGVLRWPRRGVGWYWTPEAELVLGSKHARVLEAWIWNGDGSKPFRFVHDAYYQRVELQHRGDPAEKAYKWALAAMYGAFARRVGWNRQLRKAPPSHELAWAGFITSWCRANVYKPAMRVYFKGGGRGLISIDTDGVCSTIPFDPEDLPNGVGEGLGQWKLTEYTGIMQWQNGIYWLRDGDGNWIDPKSRGIPKGSIPFAAALEAYESMDFAHRPFIHPTIELERTRFIGYGQALRGQFNKWRKWVTEPVSVMMGGNPSGKAWHFFARCASCVGKQYPPEDVRSLHTITATAPSDHQSFPHWLPWLEEQPDLPPGFVNDVLKVIAKDEDME